MEMQKPRIAFTTNAFVHALQTYGENLFLLVPTYGKLFVNEHYLCGHREIVRSCLDDEWLKPLMNHWFDIIDPPPFGESDEIAILAKLDQLYPDNVIVVVDKLREYSRLNRVYANDELYTTEKLWSLIEEVKKNNAH